MLYFVTWEYVETGTLLPSAQVAPLLEQAIVPSLQMCADMEKRGKFLAGGVFAGSRASAVIVEEDSHDELSQLLQSLPFWSLMKMNVTPLQKFEDRAAQERRALDYFKVLEQKGALPW
jgi:muconolactone delta-isomerase